MKKETFIKLVQKELDTIKEKATKEELKKLVFKNFDHSKIDKCIYGLLTDYYASKRAREICEKSFNILNFAWGIKFATFEEQPFSEGDGYTALEKYLYMVDAKKHREIFRYLKGKQETIDLTLD